MKITTRKTQQGRISWVVDFGKVAGKRVQRSFKTRIAAERAQARFLKLKRHVGSEGLKEVERRIRSVADLSLDLDAERNRMLEEESVHRLELDRSRERLEVALRRAPLSVSGLACPEALRSAGDKVFRFQMEHASAIYFLGDKDGAILYVGQSSTFWVRVDRHVANGKIPFAQVWYLPCPVDELDQVERYWIDKLNPPFNGVFPEWMLIRRKREPWKAIPE